MQDTVFDDIRPYYDIEVNEAVQRIAADPNFTKILDFFFKDQDKNHFKTSFLKIDTIKKFQTQIMHPIIWQIIKHSSDGLTWEGFDKLDPEKAYLFVSNHRDILLDSAILQLILHDCNLETSEITFGSNLMINPFIIDIGKINRMFTVHREGTMKEFIKNSAHLSDYIRHTITKKNKSVWIAQRNGRTKNGDDKTEQGLLKMLNVSGKKSFEENFRDLNIIPLSVSYEYEPCDVAKVNEVYINQSHTYIKKPLEDLNSIITGATQNKGKMHFAVGKSVNTTIDTIENGNVNNKIKAICDFIDNEIYTNYKLNPVNYVAYDLLNNSQKFSDRYLSDEKENFIDYMNNQISCLQGERSELQKIFLNIYANPVNNNINISKKIY